MTVKMPISFPIFPTPPLSPNRRWSTTVIRFSRWNNANAEPFNRLLRTQQHIEHDLRLSRRYNSADRIVIDEDVSVSSSLPFRSVGTPSIPSRPSIPGRKSKYSKNRAADVAVRYSRRGDDDVESKGRWGSGGERRRFPDDDLVSRRSRDGDDDVADNAAEELLKYSESRQSRRYGNRFGNDDVALESRSGGSGGERGQLGDDDVAEHAPEESYGNRFRDDDVAEDRSFRGHDGGDDVAVSGSRSSNYSTSAEERESGQVDVAGKSYHPAFSQFSNADMAGNNRFTNSVGNRARGENADVAINRRFNNSVEQRGGGRGADVAENPSKHLRNLKPSHPAFRRFRNSVEKREDGGEEGVRVMEDGVSYMVGGAPFEFMYSYTETPKVKPVRLREPPVAPFGPTTMARPWTGRKPLAKKTLPEFDSFKLPPPHKKGVKPVQSPGPFLPGSGPKYVHSREEILGEPLSKKEIEELVNGCRKSRRQMHMGRDGLTHNMLENIHAHWKRRRLCKIKCLGVCTVDMDNVHQQLEEKTGGKVIYGSGGVLYLFRGRNYNYKTRPRYPLMLWKPITPVYPRLVQRIPDGLTLEEASLMRKKGRDLIPICKLGKNGVYSNLVKDVREAFEACDIVRINCQGLNSSDYHKIGAKLKDLVPCVLLSFEREHILMWRGKEWTSSLPKLGETPQIENSEFEVTLSSTSDSEDEGVPTSFFSDSEDEKEENVEVEGSITEEDNSKSAIVLDSLPGTNAINENEILTDVDDHARNNIELSSLWTKGVQLLLKEAIDNGAAVILDNSNLDSDIVFQTALSLAKSAPRGPVFKDKRRKTVVKKPEKEKTEDLKVEEVLMIEDNNRENTKRNGYRREMVLESVKADYTNKVPQGSLRVDELAKLLA